jgi:homoserine O-acetyltransferase
VRGFAAATTWLIVRLLALAAGVARAAAPEVDAGVGAGAQQIADIGDLNLTSGQVLRGCRVGYRTFGHLDATRSNAVLFPTWFGGSTAHLVDLIGPGKLIDSSRYYVVAVDALANGISSSPSNSPTQGRMRFPEIGIRDMVESQHILLTRVLGITHVHAVMGISMGGMQTFQWAASYPTFLDRAIPIVGSPQLAAYDLLLWQAELDAIFADPDWRGGDYQRQPVLRAVQGIHALALSTPARFNHTNTRQAVLAESLQRKATGLDACDRVRQLQAMMAHDIAAPFGGALAKAGAALKTPLLVVVDARDHMVTPGPALEIAASANARVLQLDTECGHLVPSCEPTKIAAAITSFLR